MSVFCWHKQHDCNFKLPPSQHTCWVYKPVFLYQVHFLLIHYIERSPSVYLQACSVDERLTSIIDWTARKLCTNNTNDSSNVNIKVGNTAAAAAGSSNIDCVLPFSKMHNVRSTPTEITFWSCFETQNVLYVNAWGRDYSFSLAHESPLRTIQG